MRLEDGTLVLSERNLLALLTKLYTEGSACELGGVMHVKAERDSVHYGSRAEPPGRMHPVTERILSAVQKAAEGHSLTEVEDLTPVLGNIPVALYTELKERLETPLPRRDWMAIITAMSKAVVRSLSVAASTSGAIRLTNPDYQETDMWKRLYSDGA